MFLFKSKPLILVLCFITCYSEIVAAQPSLFDTCCKTILSLAGGYANLNAKEHSESYRGTDDDIFTYSHHGTENTGVVGAFAGLEFPIWGSHLYTQAGLEYDYFGSVKISGVNRVGVEPATSTLYDYQYHSQTQQLMAIAKLLYGPYHSFHPYALVGLGAAFNRLKSFSAVTSETGSINLTPTFDSHTETSFTYALGLGVDMDLNNKMRIGIGYRFSDFGSSSLGDGQVTFNNYQAPVPFSLSSSHTYANELMVNFSYLA